MNKTRNFLWAVLALGLVVISIGCNSNATNSEPEEAAPYPTVQVDRRDIISYNSFPAILEGTVSSEIRPKISGYILEVAVREGQQVRKGDLLFRLETETLSQDASAARANVQAAQVEVNKLEPLVEKNIISPVQLETAKARLAQAQSAYNSLAANIDYARIKSPVNGVVGSINFREGALVSAQDPSPLTRISDIDEVFANFSMNEKDFISFSRNAEGANLQEKIDNLPPIKLILADGSEFKEEGKIETISGDISAQTGTITFRARFDNEQGLLRNGSSATVQVPQKFEDALVIPAISTFERQNKTFVYRVAENDSIYSTGIEITARENDLIVVSSGLEYGDQILAQGIGKVRPGIRIKPQPTSIDSLVTKSSQQVFK